ncbi:DUF3662 domain-containing protein [Rothia amarae]|uniref:DUF3662 domain-containing protein n=1 Tax=Rothia amarae TaxID=169480 RepID=A0A7H2BJK5_9MICC|nr:DUF3662 and FHA domain-containing protein [Rothia amarae]QNV39851.1 DUF3662 domain-containing protein [Rothia amarae]
MGFINKIEQRLEKAVRGTFSKGGSQFEPVDLANRVRTTMDNKAYSISSGRTIAPNVFTIDFAEEDFPRIQGWGAPLAEELCDVVIRHARAQGYSLRGSVRVTFSVDDAVEAGDFLVSSAQEKVAAPQASPRTAETTQRPRRSVPAGAQYPAMEEDPLPTRITRPGSRAPRVARPQPSSVSPEQVQRPASVAYLSENARASYSPPRPAPSQVVLEINGQNYSCNSLPVVIGRSSHADITVDDTGVSRRHLEIIEQDGVYLAVDLGSTNGSYLNGQKLVGRRELSNGSVLTMGRARIVFRLMVPRNER